MAEEQTVKLYAAAFLAYREVGGKLRLRVQAGLVIALSDEEAHANGMEGARAVFPESEDWTAHEAVLTEIPRDFVLGHYQITWDGKRIHL